MRKCLSPRKLSYVTRNPLALQLDVLGAAAPGLAHHVVAHDIRKRCARSRELLGQIVDFAVKSVANDEPLLGIEHGEAARHVVEGNLEPLIDACKLFFIGAHHRQACDACQHCRHIARRGTSRRATVLRR